MWYNALIVLQVCLLSVAVPLSLVASRGYRDAPFGEVLRPLVVVAAAFLLVSIVELLPLEQSVADASLAGVTTVGLAGIVVAAVRLVILLTERRTL